MPVFCKNEELDPDPSYPFGSGSLTSGHFFKRGGGGGGEPDSTHSLSKILDPSMVTRAPLSLQIQITYLSVFNFQKIEEVTIIQPAEMFESS